MGLYEVKKLLSQASDVSKSYIHSVETNERSVGMFGTMCMIKASKKICGHFTANPTEWD